MGALEVVASLRQVRVSQPNDLRTLLDICEQTWFEELYKANPPRMFLIKNQIN